MESRYLITLQVEYEPHATHLQRSLSWLVPELLHAGLTLTEDTSDGRTWDGVIDDDTLAWLADAWDLGYRTRAYTFDAMEFEDGGFSPIVSVALSVSELDRVERQLHPRKLGQ